VQFWQFLEFGSSVYCGGTYNMRGYWGTLTAPDMRKSKNDWRVTLRDAINATRVMLPCWSVTGTQRANAGSASLAPIPFLMASIQ
jgi:hypothetical protein